MTLIETLAARARPFPIALAHALAKCKPGRDAERLELLNRLFAGLKPAPRIHCREELAECRAAQGGRRLAAVSGRDQ